MSDIKTSMDIAAAGLRAQSKRLNIIAQNVANKDSIASTPGGEPYRRQVVSFKNVLDKEAGVKLVTVDRISHDPTPFVKEWSPGHPAADEAGYVRKPNVNSIIESQDRKEALRAYEANLAVIETSKAMLNQTLDLLR